MKIINKLILAVVLSLGFLFFAKPSLNPVDAGACDGPGLPSCCDAYCSFFDCCSGPNSTGWECPAGQHKEFSEPPEYMLHVWQTCWDDEECPGGTCCDWHSSWCWYKRECLDALGQPSGYGPCNKSGQISCQAVSCVPNNPPSPTCSSAAPEYDILPFVFLRYNKVFVYNVANADNVIVYAKGPQDVDWTAYSAVKQADNKTWVAAINLASHPGDGTINVHVYMNNAYFSSVWCDSADFIRQPSAVPWWQTKDGDIVSGSSVSSKVFTGKYLMDKGVGGFPGVPIFNGTLTTTPGGVSTPQNWNANTQVIPSHIYDYTYFESLIPDEADLLIKDPQTSINTSGGDYDGYEWYSTTDPLTLGNINFGDRKVIVFVDGDLTINGPLTLNNGTGFLMIIASGNISVDPSVTGSPSIEGLFVADGNFSTGNGGTNQFHLRGSVATIYGSINLAPGRDLADDSSPAELFEYAPDLMLLFPDKLATKETRWNEVAP